MFYVAGKFQGTLKMNNAWDPKYGDHTTTEFTNLKTNLENQVSIHILDNVLKYFVQLVPFPIL
jgi:hypothetical protein